MKILMPLIISLLFIACEDNPASNDTKDTVDCSTLSDGKVIEFVSPSKGQSFKVGDTIVLKWKMNPSTLTGILPQVSNDEGSTWSEPLSSESLFTDATETNCFEFSWVIEEDLVLVDGAANSKVKFRVRDYADVLLRGESEIITINP